MSDNPQYFVSFREEKDAGAGPVSVVHGAQPGPVLALIAIGVQRAAAWRAYRGQHVLVALTPADVAVLEGHGWDVDPA